jgi:hypothetical protein
LPEPELEQLPRPVADEVTAMGAPDPGSCDRCGRRLRKDNRRGRCVRCRRGETIGPAPTASIENLPDRVQDLVDQFIRVSCYARDLEEELDRRREDGRQMKILGRRVQAALAVVADRETPVAKPDQAH